jgi:MYXO-CTERM domain-containing protein
LSDGLEATLGSDPNDADSDDDGVLDGDEPNFSLDTDGDGLINVLDPDSDNDALFDGTELGKDCSNPATDAAAGVCIADADMGATTTSPIDADTDDGGVIDGSEDTNLNGQIDMGELDPNNGADDVMVVDTDKDGLSDGLEGTLGSNPNDADSDDDGVIDGQEPNPSADTDGDGKKNVVDADSDNDGLFDGTELGKDCSNPATDPAAGTCKPDLDKGVTTTSPLDPDTDHGGVSDGKEDTNGNGVIDGGETNPNDPSDDKPACTTDADCGSATSGKVCDTAVQVCVDGCRGTNGNGCPEGLVCTSMDESIGSCVPDTTSSSSSGVGGGGAGGAGGGGLGPKDVRLSGGCAGCAIPAEDESPRGVLAVLGMALAALVRRRRRG